MKKAAVFTTLITLITAGVSALIRNRRTIPFDERFRKAQMNMREEIV